MRNSLSYYENLYQERKAEFVFKFQKEYKFDEIKELLDILSEVQEETKNQIPDKYFVLLHDIFQFMPNHERYFAANDADRINLYFERIKELKTELKNEFSFVSYLTELKKNNMKITKNIPFIFMLSMLILSKYPVSGSHSTEIIFGLFISFIFFKKVFLEWRKYKWKNLHKIT